MAKSAKNTGAERKYLAEQDEKVAMQIKEVLCFFHSEVLHGFIALTMLKSLLLIIFLILGYSVPRAARLLGFCPATVGSQKGHFQKWANETNLFPEAWKRQEECVRIEAGRNHQ